MILKFLKFLFIIFLFLFDKKIIEIHKGICQFATRLYNLKLFGLIQSQTLLKLC